MERKLGPQRKTSWPKYIYLFIDFAQDKGSPFNLEYVWGLLKDVPKWMGALSETSSKWRNTSANEAYSSSPTHRHLQVMNITQHL